MSYTVESINSCTKKLAFSFESLDLSSQIKTAMEKKRREANLKGFRKGKAPLSMIEKLFGPQIETDALNSFIQGEFFQAVTKEDLKVVGYPSFENMNYEKGKSVSFDALVEIFPKLELNDVKNLEFSKEKVDVKDIDVDGVKNNYLNSKAELKEVTDKDISLEKGHSAVLNFEGVKEDGSRPDNMKGSDFVLEIGSNQFIPGFEDAMIGMKANEEKKIDLAFPAEYHVEELKNEKVTFDVKLLEIKEKNLPEWTDELAKEMGYESMADFDAKTREQLATQKHRASSEKLHQAILDKLIEENSFEVPKAMVAQQEDFLKEDLKKNLAQQGFNEVMMKDYFDKWNEDLTSKAEFQVKSGLILEELAKKYNVESSVADLNEKISEMVQNSGMKEEQVREYYTSNEKIKKNMMYAIREEKTFAALTKDLKIS